MSQGISMIAIPWYFSNILGLGPVYGKLYLAISFVSLFWGLYSGTLVDKYDRKHIFMALSLSGMGIAGLAGFAGYFNGAGVGAAWVSLVFAATFFIYNVHYPNLYAFAQEISDPKDYSRITSWIEVQGQMTTALAGALAALLLKGFEIQLPVFGLLEVGAWQMHEIFLLDAATYLIAFCLILFIRYESVSVRHPDQAAILPRLKAGFSFLAKNPWLFLFGNASMAIFITILISGFYLIPVYVGNFLEADADVYGVYEMSFALGSVVAGLAITRIFRWTNLVVAVIVMTFVATGVYVVFSINTHLPLFYIAALILGLCNAGTRIMRVTYFFKHIPNQIIGRTGSVFNVTGSVVRLGMIYLFSLPFFHEDKNIVFAFWGFALFNLAAALVMTFFCKKFMESKVIL